MVVSISEIDFQVIRALRDQGIFEEVRGHQLPLQDGIISIQCADCDQLRDIYQHQCGMALTQREASQIHVLADNGGPLLIPRRSPGNKVGRSRDLDYLDSIGFAMEGRNIKTIALCGHAPCELAASCKIGILGTVALILCAQTRIREVHARRKPEITCFYQVDYGPFATDPSQPKETYFLNKNRFAEVYSSQVPYRTS